MKNKLIISSAVILSLVSPLSAFASNNQSSAKPQHKIDSMIAKESVNHHEVIQKVNINQATAEQLAKQLKGIGLKRAQAIVEYRNKNGQFQKIEQLSMVKGIGKSVLEKNKAILML